MSRDWHTAGDALLAALGEAAEAGDWVEAEAAMQRLAELLRQPPDGDPHTVSALYQRARAAMRALEQTAREAREETADGLRLLGRGRRAVRAYAAPA